MAKMKYGAGSGMGRKEKAANARKSGGNKSGMKKKSGKRKSY